MVFAAIFILFVFLAVPSLIAMLNTLAISVIERTREIGMLRAVGATRQQVSRMVLAEALLMAAFGTTFGLLAGMYLGYLLVGAMEVVGFPLTYYFPRGGAHLSAGDRPAVWGAGGDYPLPPGGQAGDRAGAALRIIESL